MDEKQLTANVLVQLENLELNQLKMDLKTDAQKLTFWINVYNATTQYQLKKSPEKFKNRSEFYSSKLIVVAKQNLSLDDIEHGILRKNKNKYSLGYFMRFGSSKFVRKSKVKKLDYRIHFALNCGAKSCPPIHVFKETEINKQLEDCTQSYLTAECELKNDTLSLPRLFQWFRGDFGGVNGRYRILVKYGVIQKMATPKIIFKDYNWDLQLENYK